MRMKELYKILRVLIFNDFNDPGRSQQEVCIKWE